MSNFDIIYHLEVDWDRDETYGHADADITSYVESISFHWGLGGAYQSFAPPAEMMVTIKDLNGDFYFGELLAGKFSQLLKPGLLVRLYATWGVNNFPLFIGKLDNVDYTPANPFQDPAAAKTVMLRVRDPMLEFLDLEYFPKYREDIKPEQALTEIFESGGVTFPYPPFTLDASILDGPDELFDLDFIEFDAGRSVIPFLGDNADSGKGVSAQGMARDIVAAELGLFLWFAPNGTFRFYERLRGFLVPNSETYEDDKITVPEPSFASEFYNALTLTFTPRKVGADYTLIYNTPNVPFRLAPKQQRVLTARYYLEDGTKVGTSQVVPPVIGLDYKAIQTTAKNTIRTAADIPLDAKDVSIHLGLYVEVGGSSAKITLYNNLDTDMWVTMLQLRGTPIITLEKQSVTEVDANSIYLYGRKEKTIHFELISDPDFAQQVAAYLVSQHSTPTLVYKWAQVQVTESTINALRRVVGEQIIIKRLLSEGNAYYHDTTYMIQNIEHTITNQWTHLVRFGLEPISRTPIFILDTSELDGNAVLAL